MKVFISYCDSDGEGLEYARKAKEICKGKSIEAWVWRDESSSAECLDTDITKNIKSCNAMLIIVTAGTANSEPQREEWSLASSFGKIKSSISKIGLPLQPELRARRCLEFNDCDFETVCNKAIDDIAKIAKSEIITKSKELTAKEFQLYDIASGLEKRSEGLKKEVIDEFNKCVWEGYLRSTIIRNITRLSEASGEDKESLGHIAIRSNLELDEFNAEDYYWEPAFEQLGENIALGEKGFLVRKIIEEVKATKEYCYEKRDDLSVILTEIERLNGIGYTPDIILAPPSMMKYFLHFFKDAKGKITHEREHGYAATLELEGLAKLRIYLLGGGVLSENLIIFNSSSIIWKVITNPDTGYALTMGIGKGLYPDKVSFIIGTTVGFVLEESKSITRIPIKK